jgi:hypothetical protein
MILHGARRNYSVQTLTYTHVSQLSKKHLENVLETNNFAQVRAIIRKAAIRLALRREFIEYARAVSGKMTSIADIASEHVQHKRVLAGSAIVKARLEMAKGTERPEDHPDKISDAVLAATQAARITELERTLERDRIRHAEVEKELARSRMALDTIRDRGVRPGMPSRRSSAAPGSHRESFSLSVLKTDGADHLLGEVARGRPLSSDGKLNEVRCEIDDCG